METGVSGEKGEWKEEERHRLSSHRRLQGFATSAAAGAGAVMVERIGGRGPPLQFACLHAPSTPPHRPAT